MKRFKQGFKITEARAAWAKVAWGSVALMYYKNELAAQEDTENEEGVQSELVTEVGPTVRFLVRKNNRSRPMTLDLTMLTLEELLCLEKIFQLGIDSAKPICQLRDEEAQKEYAQGDDTNTRVYRPVPQFVKREGSIPEHIESIRDRLRSDDKGDEPGLTPSGDTVRDDIDAVAEPEPSASLTQDDGPTPD